MKIIKLSIMQAEVINMFVAEKIKNEMRNVSGKSIKPYLKYQGLISHIDEPVTKMRAYAIESLFTGGEKHIYKDDLIAGSQKGYYSNDVENIDHEIEFAQIYELNNFSNNFDHFAGTYDTFLNDGIEGTIKKINDSLEKYQNDEKKQIFLKSAKITMEGFSKMCLQYAEAAEYEQKQDIADVCRNISQRPPKTFREALQLIWLVYQAFLCEDRFAMALARIDQYLYPYYKKDIENGTLTHEFAIELLSSAFIKIGESRMLLNSDDVVNICIGGVDKEGKDATNKLSYAVLEAVKRANIPGPNLSARIHKDTPKEFFLACLDVIGTGLGYPALMNDEINIPALLKIGYKPEHARDYSMVGCIENFITGMQPPWSDSRFNASKYMELIFNKGRCMLTNRKMGQVSDLSKINTMTDFLVEYKRQLIHAAKEYIARFKIANRLYNPEYMEQPFLSCFCYDCIGRGLDINNGGAYYPSVHGAGCMGISTVADALAAIEELVFNKKEYTILEIGEALKHDFVGYEKLQSKMLSVPKYGNNIELPDKYAVWYLDTMYEIFESYRTHDGGRIYIAVAANIQNISAGYETGATADGRNSRKPLNDAASPTYGMDKNGPTAVVLSCTKPDYTKAACGTVLNQKFNPVFFKDEEKREKLYSLIRTYFNMGGQEIQINSVSKDVLKDAMENPENYQNLVIRVSGFSAYYTSLDRKVQEDILMRTENE